jgi:hypothetical protein
MLSEFALKVEGEEILNRISNLIWGTVPLTTGTYLPIVSGYESNEGKDGIQVADERTQSYLF